MRLLLIAALLVTGVAPAWAQSDNRWIALFHLAGDRGRGQSRSIGGNVGTANAWMAQTHHIGRTIFDRTGTPYKEFSLPDSGQWAAIMGTTRQNGEADSVMFRRMGCMGWIMTYNLYSSAFDGDGYSAEGIAYFTGTGTTKGTFACGPLGGGWGMPGVAFTAQNGTQSNQDLVNGIVASATPSGTGRVRQAFANGDSISMLLERWMRLSPADSANVTVLMRQDTLSTTLHWGRVAAWKYKNATWYSSTSSPYLTPTPIMLAVAGMLNEAGYRVKRKLNLHIDLDHPFPDQATTDPQWTDSLFRYTDRVPWRFGGPIESHSSEIADDNATVKELWRVRSVNWPGHPHSHNFLNFGSGDVWNMSTFADSATKAARWTFMEKQIADTLRSSLQRGYERTATFPNNDVSFPDLFIPASAGYRNIRAKTLGGADSLATPKNVSLRRWQQVPSARRYSSPITTYGLPYAYIEPKTNKLLYIHDSVEYPASSDITHLTQTYFAQDMESYSDAFLSNYVRMAIFDGGAYWHPDNNVTQAKFMATLHRRLLYFYNRVSNIMEITPLYQPRTPRKAGGTARTY